MRTVLPSAGQIIRNDHPENAASVDTEGREPSATVGNLERATRVVSPLWGMIAGKERPPRTASQTKRARPKLPVQSEPIESPDADGARGVGGAQPPDAGKQIAGDFWRDEEIIAAYAQKLLGDEASLIEAEDLAIFSRMPTDAPLQHVISAKQVSRMLAANGATLARFLADRDPVTAERELMRTMSIYVDRLPRFMTASKETLDETMRVFRTVHASWAGEGFPSDEQLFAHYLRQTFSGYAEPEVFDRLARVIVKFPNAAPLRRIAHISHLSNRLAARHSSLDKLLNMSSTEAGKQAWIVGREGDHGGAAAYETFEDWFARMSPQTVPEPESVGLTLDLDEVAKARARRFAMRNFGKSLPDLIEATEQEWGHAARDSVTWFYDARIDTVLTDIVAAARRRVQTFGELIWYVELDVINLGGLNKHFADDQPKANVHVRQVCSILLNVLSPRATSIVPFRIAGDEFGVAITGVDETQLLALLEEARQEVVKYTEGVTLAAGLRLSEIDTAKMDGQKGFGLHSGYAKVGVEASVQGLREATGAMINRSKRGGRR